MVTLMAFDFTNHQVILRSVGLLAVVILFFTFAYFEYAGPPSKKRKRLLNCLIVVSVIALLYVLVSLKGV
jgi:uncharacterized protein (DUF486 family)